MEGLMEFLTSPIPGFVDGRIVEITPETARQVLDQNEGENYRRLGLRWVKRYLADMARGWWRPVPALYFSEECKLMDGQHRIAAISQMSKPVNMLVIRNCPPEWVDAFDRGRLRSLADLIQKIRANTAGIMDGTLRAHEFSSGSAGITGIAVATFYQENIDIAEFVESLPIYNMRKLGRKGVMTAFARAYLSTQRDVDLRVAADRLARLDFDGDNDPMRRLYMFLADNKSSGGWPMRTDYLKTAKALRYELDGQQIGVLRLSDNEADPFPLPDGFGRYLECEGEGTTGKGN